MPSARGQPYDFKPRDMNGSSRNHLLLSHHLQLTPHRTMTKQLNDMTNSVFLQPHIDVPRIDDREVVLQTTRLDALRITQVITLYLCKRSDSHLLTVTELGGSKAAV
jgi:hypothetical protein